jgi:hypothetical protein
MYINGHGVTQDYKEAVKWFRKAAEQGNAAAQASMGHLYEEGKEVAKDYKEAEKWFRKAAKQGNAAAQSRLGLMYSRVDLHKGTESTIGNLGTV